MRIAGVLLCGLAVCALPWALSGSHLRFATEILYLGLVAVSFNMLFGYARMLPFGHNATFGLGGYAASILLTRMPELTLLVSFCAAILCSGLAAVVIGAFCVRLKGGYFALMSLAFCQFLYSLAIKWRMVTSGLDGMIVPLRSVSVFGVDFSTGDTIPMFYFTAVTVSLFLALGWAFTLTPLGRAVVLTRECEERAAFLGFNVYAVKLAAFTLAGTMAGAAGALFAILQGLISPSTLGIGFGGEIMFMTILGGSGSYLGPFLGAVCLTVLNEALSAVSAHPYFFIGAIYIAMVLFAPAGLSHIASVALGRLRARPGFPKWRTRLGHT